MFELSIALACFFGVLLFFFGVALWEKKPIDTYGPALSGEFPRSRRYLVATRSDAVKCGLREMSLHKNRRFDVFVVFWFSPERDFYVSAQEGKIANIQTMQTWIFSRLQNGVVFVTSNGFGEVDPFGWYVTKRFPNLSLADLIDEHRKRLDAEGCAVVRFDDITVDEAARNVQRERAERLIEMGRAKWVDDEQSVWQYTLSGAFHLFSSVWAGSPISGRA